MNTPGEPITVRRARSESDRASVAAVLQQVYVREKGWIPEGSDLLPPLGDPAITWLLAESCGLPLGITRIRYRPPRELVEEYSVDLVDPSFDVDAFLARAELAEVGRFAVVPAHRRRLRIAATLMRATVLEARARGVTHLITDVFEDETNSPFAFHRLALGFELVAFHHHGELRHEGRRATLVLDLEQAVERARRRRSWIERFIVDPEDDPAGARFDPC